MGRFSFNVLPFGISSGSEKFHSFDVLVHGKNQEEDDERVEALLKRLVEAGVSLNLDKCRFSIDKVKFLGHVISFRGIEADPDKLQPIADLPPP